MTKILNFSVVEILPALLNKSKTQTIRPAWKKCPDCNSLGISNKITKIRLPCPRCHMTHIIGKPSRFKVGEKVQIYWNQRSKYSRFCKKCGKPFSLNGIGFDSPLGVTICGDCGKTKSFPKKLGEGIITEVFKIEMFRFTEEPQTICVTYSGEDKPTMTSEDMDEIAKRDGFNSDIDMIKWFQTKYIPENDTNTKFFWVYRWKWLK